ncbi:MAG: SIR2 family protein [Pirellula sp.]
MGIQDELAAHLAKIGTAPFLFVGSGLSRRYVNLEDWERLLRRFSDGFQHPFEYYKAKASSSLPAIATLLADSFYDTWWTDAKYLASRDSFTNSVTNNASCLKYEIAQYISNKKYEAGQNAQLDKEIELLKTATVDGIVTTNWDTMLESLFPEFEAYIGQEQVLFSNSQGIAELYKIHGCVTEPNSLVLTTADYDEFNNRNPYLAAKLLTIFVEHPVIFLGYSLSDENIRGILRQVASCLTNDNIQQLQDRLIFVQRDTTGKGDSFESSVLQINTHTLPVTIIRTNDYAQVYQPLSNLKRRFSARLLRKMKEHIYELVRTNDPKEKIAVIDINDAETFDDLEVVYGVGVQKKIGSAGYTPISRLDLLKDAMAEQSHYDAQRIVEATLPELLKQAKYVPIFRYLRGAGCMQRNGAIDGEKLHERVAKAISATHEDFYPPQQYRGELSVIQDTCQSIKGVLAHYASNHFFYVPMLKHGQIDLDDLRKYILANMNLITCKNTTNATYFRSLICFYDWLKYR